MHHGKLVRSASLVACIALMAAVYGAAVAAEPSKETPCLSVIDKFTAPDVPAMGPAEIALNPRKPSTRPLATNLPGNGLAQHSMLYAGEGYNKMFLVHGGKVVWTYSTGPGGEYDDVWMLSNGNILYTRMSYIAEITPDKREIWRYTAPDDKSKPATHTEIHACQPIGLDRVLFAQNGLPPKLMIVNIKTGAVEVSHDLDYIQPPLTSTIHPQFRRIRMTGAGTFLVPYLNMGKVVEYDKDFKEVWRWPDAANTGPVPAGQAAATASRPAVYLTDGSRFTPWAAIRLKNGNTLITSESGRSQIEVNPAGKIVWQLKPADLPEAYRYSNTQTCTRLANGNTIVCSQRGPQLVEVTPDKKVVWVIDDFSVLGGATAVQILDDPGIPENPGDSEH